MDLFRRGSYMLALAAMAMLGSLTLTGCEGEMQQIATSRDPSVIASQAISLYGLMALVFICCADMGLRKGLLVAAQWTGVILVFLAPLRFLSTQDITTSAVIGATGLTTALLARFMLRPQKKVIVKKQVLDETAEERMRRLEEENRALEARLNEQERRMDGKKPPHR